MTKIRTWEQNTDYKKGDLVIDLNILYKATAKFTSGVAFNKDNWQKLGAFAKEDTATLQNYTTNLNIKNAKGNTLTILDPEHFSATIFQRLEDKVEAIQTKEVKESLLSFL